MYRIVALVVALAVLPGCGAVDILLESLLAEFLNAPTETNSAKLIAFESEQELVDYFSGQVDSRNDSFFAVRGELFAVDQVLAEGERFDSSDGSDAPAPPSASLGGDDSAGITETATDSDFSQTTIQVEGVDEPDVVKSDGTHLYIIDNGTLRIVQASPPEELAVLATIQLEGTGRNIFLHDQKVIALTETGFFYGGGGIVIIEPIFDIAVADGEDTTGSSEDEVDIDPAAPQATEPEEPKDEPAEDEEPTVGIGGPAVAPLPVFSRPKTYVTVIDVSTPAAPVVLSTTAFEGTPTASRMIDGVLHLVVSNFQDYYFDVLPRLGLATVDTASLDSDAILPGFERMDATGAVIGSGSLLTWQEMFRPTDPDGFGVVSLVSLDVDADAAFTAVGIVAEPGHVFSSLTAMYLTDTEFNFFSNTRDTTDIYKFEYVGRGAVPVATGSVPGRVLNQYSMDEHAGHLRVATTTRDATGFRFEPANNVFVLADTGGELEVVGSITDIAPGETIQSARFMGDRGYLVTFEQIDPLFTLDLSDPTDPKVVGELKVPGFSTFIVPIDANHLLTVGQYIPEDGRFFARGVQLSIFDVTEFDNPQLTALAVIGEESGASSEALFNPKAFTYFAQRGLIALPISIYDDVVFFDDFIVIGDEIGVDVSEEGVATDGDSEVDEGTATEGGTGTETAVAVDEPDEPAGISAPEVRGGFDGVVFFSLDIDTGFEELGRISTRLDDVGFFFASFTRGLFIGDNVYAVTNHGIHSAPLADLASAPIELLFDSP